MKDSINSSYNVMNYALTDISKTNSWNLYSPKSFSTKVIFIPYGLFLYLVSNFNDNTNGYCFPVIPPWSFPSCRWRKHTNNRQGWPCALPTWERFTLRGCDRHAVSIRRVYRSYLYHLLLVCLSQCWIDRSFELMTTALFSLVDKKWW